MITQLFLIVMRTNLYYNETIFLFFLIFLHICNFVLITNIALRPATNVKLAAQLEYKQLIISRLSRMKFVRTGEMSYFVRFFKI